MNQRGAGEVGGRRVEIPTSRISAVESYGGVR